MLSDSGKSSNGLGRVLSYLVWYNANSHMYNLFDINKYQTAGAEHILIVGLNCS